jgi:glycogen synthase
MTNSGPDKPQLNVLVTGTTLFLARYKHIFEALTQYFARLDYLPEPPLGQLRWAIYKGGLILRRRAPRAFSAAIERLGPLHPWDARIFIARSLRLESQIARLPKAPDLIIHTFGMYCPFWKRPSIPYAMILDYTEALAHRNWHDWAPFATDSALRARLDCERRAYDNAVHLFPFGSRTRQSLIEDYGVDPGKITVIGSSGHYSQPFSGKRTFGSKRIFFYCTNGPDFYRKGGDRVLAAFQIVRQHIPDAKLAIVGMSSAIAGPGLENHGFISSPDRMRELFLSADLVVAPARCDPFPAFLIEAMNFGVPCVTSDVDGMPEIVADQVTGLVVSDVSAHALAAEVVNLLNDTQRLFAMSQSGRQRAAEIFTNAHVASVVAGAIRTLPIHGTADRQPQVGGPAEVPAYPAPVPLATAARSGPKPPTVSAN